MRNIPMKNMELFDLYAAKVFATLYETFPERTNLYLSQITKTDIDPEEPLSKEAQIARETILWLKENNYLTFRSDEFFLFTEVRLTEKGLSLLKRPESLKGEKSFGERLIGALKTGGETALKELIRVIISLGAGLKE
ncbi:MAG: hypothetical protein QXX12_02720 [Nanopusillaceae archaeon]